MPHSDEWLEVIDDTGRIVGTALRSELHSDPSRVHRVVHVLVFDAEGRLLLQKRSLTKDIAPGRWDTSVGGHISPGETVEEAAYREMSEELGLDACRLKFLYSRLYRNHRESEMVHTYSCLTDRQRVFDFCREEITEVKFWSFQEIRAALGTGLFSSHFEQEFRHYIAYAEKA